MMSEGMNTKYMLTDALGSVTAVYNASTATVEFTTYDVYGNSETAPASPYGYAGMRYVAAFDGYITPNRAYSPKLGRWLQSDPLGTTPNPQTGNVYSPLKQYSDGMNLYAYVGNEPVNGRDEWGLVFDTTPWNPIDDPITGKPLPGWGNTPSNPTTNKRVCPLGYKRVPRKNYKPSYNGCGAADGFRIPQLNPVDFTPSCNEHDICYGTCNSAKMDCDNRLFDKMVSQCINYYSGYSLIMSHGRRELFVKCVYTAAAYRVAMMTSLSENAFIDAQKNACICCPR